MLFKIARPLLAPDGAVAAAPAASQPAAAAPAAEPAKTDDPWADLDAAITPPKKPDAKPADKPADKAPDKPADVKPDPKAKAPDKPTDTKPDDRDGKTFTTPKALRDAHDRATGELKQARESIRTLETRIADYEKKGADTSKLTERLTALEKERDEAKATVRLLKFEASDEFKTKYEKPFKRAADRAKALIEGLQITETDAAGEAKNRIATWDDFAQLYNMPKAKAIPLVNSLFGQAAPVVLGELLSLQKMDLDKQDALEEERQQFGTRQAEEQAKEAKATKEQSEQNETVQKLWIQLNKDGAEKNPEYFMPDPKDKKAAELLEKAFQLVDSKHNSESMTLTQRVHLDAQIRLRAAGYSVALYRIAQRDEQISELKAQLEEALGSKPGDTQRPGGAAAPAKEQTFEEELAEAKW